MEISAEFNREKNRIVVLPTNFMPAVLELAPKIRAALTTIKPGDYLEIKPD